MKRYLSALLFVVLWSAAAGAATWYVAIPANGGSDSNAGTSSGAPFATPGKAASSAAAGDTIYVQSGTYTLSTSAAGAGGPVLLPSGKCILEGYNTTPGDLGTAPVISAGSLTGLTYIVKAQGTGTNATNQIINIAVDGASGASNQGFADGNTNGSLFYLCSASNCPTAGYPVTASGHFVCCKASACGYGFQGGIVHGCVATGCTTVAFSDGGQNSKFIRCIAYSNQVGFYSTGQSAHYFNCVAYKNTSHGFRISYNTSSLIDCISYGNSGWQCFVNTATDAMLINFAFNTGGSGGISTAQMRPINEITLTADPFVNGPTDFRINKTAGGGALLYALGLAPPGQQQTNDVGAVQHSDPTGGGATVTFSNADPSITSGTLALSGGTAQLTGGTAGTLYGGTAITGSNVLSTAGTFTIGTTTYTPSSGGYSVGNLNTSGSDVLSGITWGPLSAMYTGTVTSGSGSSIDPGSANVLNGTAYQINGSNKTGTYVVPTAAQIKFGVTFGPASIYTGTYAGHGPLGAPEPIKKTPPPDQAVPEPKRFRLILEEEK